MHFTATIAAPSGDATTRTVYTEDGTTINVKWKVGDEIALVHNGVVDVAEVKTVDDVTGKATIEADITGSPKDNDDVYLAYPADAVASATPYSPFPFTPNPTIFDKVNTTRMVRWSLSRITLTYAWAPANWLSAATKSRSKKACQSPASSAFGN